MSNTSVGFILNLSVALLLGLTDSSLVRYTGLGGGESRSVRIASVAASSPLLALPRYPAAEQSSSRLPAMTDNIIVPVKLDAFVLNASVVSSGPSTSRIAPITQPNYAALRPNPFDIQHDLLQDLDVRYAKDPSTNPRVTDIANGLPRLNRLGVYLHWMLPRVYRIAVNATPSAETGKEGFNAKARKKGFRNSLQSSNGPDDKDAQAPQYRQVPNRWLIVRWIPDKTTILPVDAKDKVPEFQAFLIESDRCQGIGDLEDDVDAEVEAAPFVDPSKGLEDQAE